MRFFDSHAHYDDHRFTEEFDGGVAGAMAHIRLAGVERVCNVGASLRSSRTSLALAETYRGQDGFPTVVAAVGIHPCDGLEIDPAAENVALDELRNLLSHPLAVALGEIGLDYHWDEDHHDRQKALFDRQLSLAEEVRKPVIIHDRDAHGDTFDILAAHPGVCGVLHSYSGSPEMTRQLSERGWYISFSGPVTYKNAAKVKDACAIVPAERLLIETDAPYLPPVPHRGKMNHSGYLVHTAAVMGEIRGTSVEEIAELTYQNACRFFAAKDEGGPGGENFGV